jgi:hypothetical protein
MTTTRAAGKGVRKYPIQKYRILAVGLWLLVGRAIFAQEDALKVAYAELGLTDATKYESVTGHGGRAAFICYCELESGHQIPRDDSAQAWLATYREVKDPLIGDIILVDYGFEVAVGFYLGELNEAEKEQFQADFLALTLVDKVAIRPYKHRADSRREIYLRP